MNEGDIVIHKELGQGTVISVTQSNSVVVRFGDNIQIVKPEELQSVQSVESQMLSTSNDQISNTKALTRLQALLIKNINDVWGVFSRSSIDLLPHQLWVCKQVLKEWPVRYLVADDVGLGKTIEAGLIISSLKATGKAKRILVLTPAKLVKQWADRLYDMFNISLTPYSSDQEKYNQNFWNSHDSIVASFSTVQADSNDRHKHILEAEPWDLVLVDEAHHMNCEEHTGATLQYALFNKLQKAGKITSAILFTGTPHRGKNYGFWSLMSLIDPDVFSPYNNEDEMYHALPNYFIRNNKQNAVDMQGTKLFKPMHQHPYTFTYSEEEQNFYDEMTNFILTGKAYAKECSQSMGNSVNLLLTALQKIAASSISAIMGALATRKKNLEEESKGIQSHSDLKYLQSDEEDYITAENFEKVMQKENFKLMNHEIEHINELLALGSNVKQETRIIKIIDIIKRDYPNEQILLFTEYKRTQALMMTSLMKEWGKDCVTIINGDEELKDVVYPDGSKHNFAVPRLQACEDFNTGKKRFLISTEAAGEGIDLQKNCHILIHIDLPWNPMRLHQRVGRVNRLGQKFDVDVISIRNENNIETKIWNYLTNKINNIEKAFTAAMDDPDDMMMLVLGMQSDSFYDSLYTEALSIPKEHQQEWFNQKTQTFGGKSAIEVATQLGLNAARFNLTVLKDVPQVDLPDLTSFMKNALKVYQKKLMYDEEKDTYSFNLPIPWKKFGALPTEKDLIFRRKLNPGESGRKIVGVGYFGIDKALENAFKYEDYVVQIQGTKSYFIYSIYNEITVTDERVNNALLVISFDTKTLKFEKCELDDFYKNLSNGTIKYSIDEEKASLCTVPVAVKKFAEENKEKLGIQNPVLKLECTLRGWM